MFEINCSPFLRLTCVMPRMIFLMVWYDSSVDNPTQSYCIRDTKYRKILYIALQI